MKIRIIPTILTDGLTVVKGENFNNWRTVGSAEATARLFANRNVDELMYLDVNARKRNSMIDLELVKVFANLLDIPFSVGGGINSLQDASCCFRNGAEKIVLGTAALERPQLISEIADAFGSQAVAVSIDAGSKNRNQVFTHSGSVLVDMKPVEVADLVESHGAGEILLQSVQSDGCMQGYDLDILREVSTRVNIPVIASSGAGSLANFIEAVEAGASAVAAGAFFQFTQYTPHDVREFLRSSGVPVREI